MAPGMGDLSCHHADDGPPPGRTGGGAAGATGSTPHLTRRHPCLRSPTPVSRTVADGAHAPGGSAPRHAATGRVARGCGKGGARPAGEKGRRRWWGRRALLLVVALLIGGAGAGAGHQPRGVVHGQRGGRSHTCGCDGRYRGLLRAQRRRAGDATGEPSPR